MKKPLYLVSLLFVLGACGTPSPQVTPLATPTPTPSASSTAQANAFCGELSFYLDPVLATGYVCETVPASADELEPNPEYTRVTLDSSYPLAGTFFSAHLSVFPVAAYDALVPGRVPGLVASIQALTAGGATPTFTSSFDSPLPFLQVFNAAQAFFAQYGLVSFDNGDGIRFLTEITQYTVPVNNTDLFYTYQGLTDDGQYWVSVTMPINHPALPANADNPPGGVTWEQFSDDYETYIMSAVGQLNGYSLGDYTPSISILDLMVSSISITP